MSVTLTINGKTITAPKDATILEAARSAGINIPTLCHHPGLTDCGKGARIADSLHHTGF
jgi:NADH dehydrogenase/NADH:ubiquinone oxidoreductase subunit G